MLAGEGGADAAHAIEADGLVVGDAVSELTDVGEVTVDVGLVLALPLVGEDAQQCLAAEYSFWLVLKSISVLFFLNNLPVFLHVSDFMPTFAA